MGIFSKSAKTKAVSAEKPKSEKEQKVVSEKAPSKTEAKKSSSKVSSFNTNGIIKNPRITEKAAHVADDNVYTFDVYPGATKTEVAKAIKEIYKVTPTKVNVVAIPRKAVYRKNTLGVKGGGRKAYVYLKKGDKIEFI